MTRLTKLYNDHGQSPWLDNLTRDYLRDGTLQRFVDRGVRGVTANPTIFAKAISRSDAYDEQFAGLLGAGCTVRDAYWELVLSDIDDALALFGPLHHASGGVDGFVSVEVDPALADDTESTIRAARALHRRLDRSNLFVKIPATDAGIPAIEAMTAEGRSINVTLIFSIERYRQVIAAYQAGLERLAADDGDLANVHSVASFFLSRVDNEIDRRLDAHVSHETHALLGRAAVAQAKLAYRVFREHLDTNAWKALAGIGANPQRPLWASTSTKNSSYPDTMYTDTLIGPDSVTTLTEATIDAFEDHGKLARTVDDGTDEAAHVIDRLGAVGIDLDDVGATLERDGVASFAKSFDELLGVLETKATHLARR